MECSFLPSSLQKSRTSITDNPNLSHLPLFSSTHKHRAVSLQSFLYNHFSTTISLQHPPSLSSLHQRKTELLALLLARALLIITYNSQSQLSPLHLPNFFTHDLRALQRFTVEFTEVLSTQRVLHHGSEQRLFKVDPARSYSKTCNNHYFRNLTRVAEGARISDTLRISTRF